LLIHSVSCGWPWSKWACRCRAPLHNSDYANWQSFGNCMRLVLCTHTLQTRATFLQELQERNKSQRNPHSHACACVFIQFHLKLSRSFNRHADKLTPATNSTPALRVAAGACDPVQHLWNWLAERHQQQIVLCRISGNGQRGAVQGKSLGSGSWDRSGLS